MNILDEMTKEELIWYIKSTYIMIHHPLKKSTLLSYRWNVQATKIQRKREIHTKNWKSYDAKSRDTLAKQFNTTTDPVEKNKIYKQLVLYEDQIFKLRNNSDKLRDEQEIVDKLYDQIDIERKKENEQNS